MFVSKALCEKLSGNILSSSDYEKILDEIEKDDFSLAQIAAFVTACHNFMTNQELAAVTGAMINKNVMSWTTSDPVVCFCSLGGIGNAKAGLLASFIVAGQGIKTLKPCISKDYSGSIGDSGFSEIADTNLGEKQIGKLLKTNGIAVFNLENFENKRAVSKLFSACREIGITHNNLIIASILALSVSYGISHILFEIPIGKTSNVKTLNEAVRLRSTIEQISNLTGRISEVVFTDGSEPPAFGIGSVFELDDVKKVLKNAPDAPSDLRERTLFLAGKMLNLCTDCGTKGYEIAEQILTGGKALDCFEKSVAAQGAKNMNEKGEFQRNVSASYDGIVKEIDCQTLEQIMKHTAITSTIGTGIILNKKVGDEVKNGDVLYTIYCAANDDFDAVSALVEQNNGYIVSAE